MCTFCNNTQCSCSQPVYSSNWYNISNYPCNPCVTPAPCKKKIPAKCTMYNGANLTFFNLTTNVDVETVIAAFASTIETIQTTQNTKNANIVLALNDINDRIAAITGTPHTPYVI